MAALVMSVDTTQLRAAYKQAKAAGGGLPVDLRRAVVAAGTPLKQAVQASASWSTRIPGAVKVKASFGKNASVSIVVDAKKAPEAAPLNNGGKGGQFRHPVYGSPDRTRDEWGWASQTARPFFDAPIQAAFPKADQAMWAALRDFEKRAGFSG